MTKLKQYNYYFFPFLFFFSGVYVLLNYFNLFQITFNHSLIIALINILIFGVSALIITPGLRKAPTNFTGSFLILTTLQMLSVLSVILAFVYAQTGSFRQLGFHMISLFMVFLIYQSALLIYFSNRNPEV